MEREQCPPEENILRAIATPNWDPPSGRLRRSYFAYDRSRGNGLSVSRLAILSRDQLIGVFLREIQRPPEYMVKGTVEINVGALQEIGRNYREKPKNTPRPVELTVIPDETDTNPAHALIPHTITRGLSGDICDFVENNGLVTLWPDKEAGDGI